MNPIAWPDSIQAVNKLPEAEKEAIYRTLLPNWLFTDYGVDREKLTVEGQRVVMLRCPAGSRALEISVKRRIDDRDPMLYLHMADTFNNQLMVLLAVVNDPNAERFDIDVDEQGNPTHLGTMGRNLAAEASAMRAGLAPGQVRAGLRVFRSLVPQFEEFVTRLGHSMFLIEPLAYHNAIIFERYGFNYIHGRMEMTRIHDAFQPGGALHSALTPDNIFRQSEAWKTIRGRSWAIHDGILGHPFTGFQMYKIVGKEAGIDTFPDAHW